VCLAPLEEAGRGVRCGRCDLVVRDLPSWSRGLARFVLTIGACVLAGWFAWSSLDERGPRALLALSGVFLATASPWLGWLLARATWRDAALAIAAVRAHWEEVGSIAVDSRKLLEASAPGNDCPVCARAQLEGAEPGPLFARARIRCPRCRLDLAPRLTPLGFAAGIALAAALVLGGGWLLVHARESQGNDFLLRAGVGVALAALGVYAGFALQSTGDEPAREELERSKRRFERRRRGVRIPRLEAVPGSSLAENLEGIVIAIILFLVVRHFVLELFVIPTGSMAPTLLGNHFIVQCQSCHYAFAAQKADREIDPGGESVTARCPLCGTKDPENEFHVTADDVETGDKILVNKFIYKYEKPERFQVVVFKFPQRPWTNYIKRLVGLPGETIKVDARGDLWVKRPGASSFELVRKPRAVQEELWMPVSDARWPNPKGSPWRPEGDPSRWDLPRGHDRSERLVAAPGKDDAWIAFSRPIQDAYGYNRPWGSSLHDVGDVRVRATVTASSIDTRFVRLSLLDSGRAITAQVPVGSGEMPDDTNTLSSDGKVLARTGERTHVWLRPGHPALVELAYADERASLRIDGEDVLSWDDPAALPESRGSSVRLGCGPGGASFANVRVDRDIFYVPYIGGHDFDPTYKPVEIPEDAYFMMGDNSPSSADSRDWGFVRRPLIVGRAFFVWWPLDRMKLIR
jgi:signal peptidase I